MLVRRPPDGLLGGMWAFPEREVADGAGAAEAALAIAGEVVRGGVAAAEPLPTREHRFTHLHATYVPFLAGVHHVEVTTDADTVWVDLGDPVGVALPVAQRAILESARDYLASGVA
jgi:A/G-specific adenine glycosylase